MEKCGECGHALSASARRCPGCGKYIWSTGRLGCALIVLFFFGIMMIQFCQR